MTDTPEPKVTRVRLVEDFGRLALPFGGLDSATRSWTPQADQPKILMAHGNGDVTCPRLEEIADPKTKLILATALYDERECNEFWPRGLVIIELPDGTEFDFDQFLFENESQAEPLRICPHITEW